MRIQLVVVVAALSCVNQAVAFLAAPKQAGHRLSLSPLYADAATPLPGSNPASGSSSGSGSSSEGTSGTGGGLATNRGPGNGFVPVVPDRIAAITNSPWTPIDESYMRSRAMFSGATAGAKSRWSDVFDQTVSTIRPCEMFPFVPEIRLDRIEGIGTVRNYAIPPWAERAQYILSSNGRPLKATVELWVGPIRKTHTLEIAVENGQTTPVRGTLKFKKGTEVITIRTSDAPELPVSACVFIPSPNRSKQITEMVETLWNDNIKTKVQGGMVLPNGKVGNGAVRYFTIPAGIKAVQIMYWSKETGKKSLKAKMEILQGPNNPKQTFDLQCGGGSQPYHIILEMPDRSGGVIRIMNKKYMEDGLFEVVVTPVPLLGEEEDIGDFFIS